MSTLELELVLTLGGLFLLWLGIVLYVLSIRAIYDARRAIVTVARKILERGLRAKLAQSGRALNFDSIVRRLPRRTTERVAADTGTPHDLAVAFSHLLVERDRGRLLNAATGHRGDAGKWRRIGALRILAQAQAKETLPLLERALEEGDDELVTAAVAILGSVDGPGAARILVGALRRGICTRARIAAQLDDSPRSLASVLLPLLTDEEPEVRYWGARLLSAYAERVDVQVQLATLGADSDPSVRAAAVAGLGEVGGSAAVTTALPLLTDPVAFVRIHAARALRHAPSPEHARAVAALLSDEDWWVRSAAKQALVAMGPGIVEELLTHLETADSFARNGIAEVLQNLGVVDRLMASQQLEVASTLERIFVAGGARFAETSLARAERRRQRKEMAA